VLTSFDLRPLAEAYEVPAEAGGSGGCGADGAVPAAGSPDARIEALYRAHGRALYRFLLRLTFGERQAAEDLLQETLLRAWRNLEGLHPNVEALRPWLFTVARRIAIDTARARQVRPAEVGGADLTIIAAGDDEIERLVAVQAVRQALASLSPEHRSVLVEGYYRGHSTRETAARLGIPEGTVKSRTYYALKALRVALTAGEGA
jgi:RNA polymerase sigma-70 factor (ECF subfamily)